jgi:hypothetical protein
MRRAGTVEAGAAWRYLLGSVSVKMLRFRLCSTDLLHNGKSVQFPFCCCYFFSYLISAFPTPTLHSPPPPPPVCY